MKLTTKSEYSLLLLLALARKKSEIPVNLEILCNETKVPYKYAEQLFSILKKNRIVKARRGSQGGYQLAAPASTLTIAEIVRLMDGALAPTESVSRYFYSNTPIAQEKKLTAVFQDIRDYIAEKLEHLSLEDLL